MDILKSLLFAVIAVLFFSVLPFRKESFFAPRSLDGTIFVFVVSFVFYVFLCWINRRNCEGIKENSDEGKGS